MERIIRPAQRQRTSTGRPVCRLRNRPRGRPNYGRDGTPRQRSRRRRRNPRDRRRPEPDALVPLLQLHRTAQHHNLRRTRNNGIRTPRSHRSENGGPGKRSISLHGRRRTADDRPGTRNYNAVRHPRQNHTPQQQLPRQRTPVAVALLQQPLLNDRNGQPRLRQTLRSLRHRISQRSHTRRSSRSHTPDGLLAPSDAPERQYR